MQFAFGAIVEQVVGLSPEAPLIRRLLEHYSTFMKGLVSVPLNIPGTPYARAVEVRNYSISVVKYLRRLIFFLLLFRHAILSLFGYKFFLIVPLSCSFNCYLKITKNSVT